MRGSLDANFLEVNDTQDVQSLTPRKNHLSRIFTRGEKTPKRDFLGTWCGIKTNNAIVRRLLLINVAKRKSTTKAKVTGERMNINDLIENVNTNACKENALRPILSMRFLQSVSVI